MADVAMYNSERTPDKIPRSAAERDTPTPENQEKVNVQDSEGFFSNIGLKGVEDVVQVALKEIKSLNKEWEYF